MSEETTVKRLWSQPDFLHIEWSDGISGEFASLWLRDNLSEDRDPHSGQRLIDIADLPENPQIKTAVARNGAVNIEWENEPRRAAFDLDWLQAQASNRCRGQSEFAPKRWLEGAALDAARDFAWARFSELRDNRALRAEWMTRLLQRRTACEQVSITQVVE